MYIYVLLDVICMCMCIYVHTQGFLFQRRPLVVFGTKGLQQVGPTGRPLTPEALTEPDSTVDSQKLEHGGDP